ncbi:hypothetical protein BJ508DRAFT_327969 [Ascobolus immersus RN42]|uniref:Uncharacterized protein n=1 Tax=Ascobolus immersus RN42 TaxID=1160509 RepID=A0A3N4I2U2_ASCIM|nr:hypothetical protein BJ508DRAFT_327969 [Ascobolus immersus RN42]
MSPSSDRTSRSLSKHGRTRHQHQQRPLPPAVANLLAATAIPQPNGGRNGRKRVARHVDLFGDVEVSIKRDEEYAGSDIFDDDESLTSSPSAPPSPSLTMLLLPPDDLDDFEEHRLSRSASSESVPSLSNDSDSWSDTSSSVSPPARSASLRRRALERRMRKTPPSESCPTDHPLLFKKKEDATPVEADAAEKLEKATRSISTKSFFKSNLTASINLLKSAAKTFTQLSAPLVQPDDFLTRSILSIQPQYRDEKRPETSEGTPDVSIRRYHNSFTTKCTGAVEMQTYKKTVRRTRNGRPEPARCATSGSSAASPPALRPREVRENGDFLRVIVLEMNMRRLGKLSDTVNGKARLVLPPRAQSKTVRVLGDPIFWEAWVAEEC